MINEKNLYHVILEKDKEEIDLYFSDFSAFEDWLEYNYHAEYGYFVPCVFGGWIDIRDCY